MDAPFPNRFNFRPRTGINTIADIPFENLDLRFAYDRFYQHRDNATRLRHVGWELTFEDWWSVWQESGRWEQRGRAVNSYCMCRVGDIGSYKIGNVFIGKFSENSRTTKKKKSTLPIGVHRTRCGTYRATRFVDGKYHRLGSFKTPELASAAYVDFGGTK